MIELILASTIWAFSFGLIKTQLVGLNSFSTASVRLALSFLVFLPFLRLRADSVEGRLKWMLIGAVQFGLMYSLYMKSFEFLKAHEVAVLTITTPLFVVFLNAALEKRLKASHLVSAVLAICAGLVLMMKHSLSGDTLTGVLLVQGSNLCFAAGQLAYRRTAAPATADHPHFAWIYLGATLVPVLFLLFRGQLVADTFHYNSTQILTLLYLGILPTGVGFFFWNRGSRKVNPGMLAVMNNLKIPFGAAVSWLIFKESVDVPRLALSLGLFGGALWTAKR